MESIYYSLVNHSSADGHLGCFQSFSYYSKPVTYKLICLSLCTHTWKSFLLGQGIPVYPSIHLPNHLSIHPFTYPFIYPPICCPSFFPPFHSFLPSFHKSSISRHITSGSKTSCFVKIGRKPATAFGKAFRVLKLTSLTILYSQHFGGSLGVYS